MPDQVVLCALFNCCKGVTVPKYSCTVNRTSGSCTQSCSCYMHNKTETWFSVCCRILPCNKENLCGALVRQSLGLYLSDLLRSFTIHKIFELFTFNRSQKLLLQDGDFIYLRKYMPKLRKS